MHARLGELLYASASSEPEEAQCELVERALRSFCRSVELCDDYLRGLYGLILVWQHNPSIHPCVHPFLYCFGDVSNQRHPTRLRPAYCNSVQPVLSRDISWKS